MCFVLVGRLDIVVLSSYRHHKSRSVVLHGRRVELQLYVGSCCHHRLTKHRESAVDIVRKYLHGNVLGVVILRHCDGDFDGDAVPGRDGDDGLVGSGY